MMCFVEWAPAALVLVVVGFVASTLQALGSRMRTNAESLERLGLAGGEGIMAPKACGTCPGPPPGPLRWGSDRDLSEDLCCHSRRGAEPPGYWLSTDFLNTESPPRALVNFYDSVTGRKLFAVPRNRTFQEFVRESIFAGRLTFRDAEVVAEHVRVLRNGEVVSVDGTHLGFNLPDWQGNGYRINIVAVSGPAPGQRSWFNETRVATAQVALA